MLVTREAPPVPPAPRVLRRRSSLFTRGEPQVWMTGGSLVLALAMIAGLLLLVVVYGASTFWPVPVSRVATAGGAVLLGEETDEEAYRPESALVADLPAAQQQRVASAGGEATRRLLRTGNYELTGTHYTWVSDYETERTDLPEWAVVVERFAWGRFYGTPAAFVIDGQKVATEPAAVWDRFLESHGDALRRRLDRIRLEAHEKAAIDREISDADTAAAAALRNHGADSAEHRRAAEAATRTRERLAPEAARLGAEIAALRKESDRYRVVLVTADGREKELPLDEIVRAYPANRLSIWGKLSVYGSRWWEFLSGDPREANSEGGVFPAIFGTVALTLIMCVLVVPFGVLAALYLREYAKQGFLVSVVRVAVNNLAGVPSIVFGVFGLGFFCYFIGGTIDSVFFPDLPPGAQVYGKGGILWASLTLALLTLPVVIVATEEAIAAVPNSMREGSYACGASKWQTVRSIVLPRAMPGIMTGMILAVARGAGEVAPLMLVGAAKVAEKLPVDGTFPFVHPERGFMHLGFHIYDLGFQSPNSEAAVPMVFTTTLLLIVIVVALNMIAVRVRSRLRRAQEGS
jgi:phosphate transport system permease protein